MTSRKLYEDDDALVDVKTVLNGLREHVDRIHKVCSIVHQLQPQSVLDVGCHFGLFGSLFRWSSQPPKRIVGVDWSLPSSETALKLGYDSVIVEDASEFKTKEFFDLVLLLEILEHVKDPTRVLDNAINHAERYVLVSTPIEGGPVDGQFHIRHISPNELVSWCAERGKVLLSEVVPSQFCEKPQWLGWTFVLLERRQ